MLPERQPNLLALRQARTQYLKDISMRSELAVQTTDDFLTHELVCTMAAIDRGYHTTEHSFLVGLISDVVLNKRNNPHLVGLLALFKAVTTDYPNDQPGYAAIFRENAAQFGTGRHSYPKDIQQMLTELGPTDAFSHSVMLPQPEHRPTVDIYGKKSPFAWFLFPALISASDVIQTKSKWQIIDSYIYGLKKSSNSHPLSLRQHISFGMINSFNGMDQQMLVEVLYMEALLGQFPQLEKTRQFLSNVIDQAIIIPLSGTAGDLDDSINYAKAEDTSIEADLDGWDQNLENYEIELLSDIIKLNPSIDKISVIDRMPLDLQRYIQLNFLYLLNKAYVQALVLNQACQNNHPKTQSFLEAFKILRDEAGRRGF